MSSRVIFLKILILVSIQSVQSDVDNEKYLDFDEEVSNSTTILNQTLVLDHRNSSDHHHAISFRKSPKVKLETFRLNTWYLVLAVIICLGLLFLLNFALTNELLTCDCKPLELNTKKDSKDCINCYLCDKSISMNSWEDGSHRRLCSNKKKSVLENLPRPLEVNCPKCLATLRLWPAHLGEGFNCDSQDCKIPKDEMMYNSGYNRLNCFDCDYNLCMTCANRMVCQKGQKQHAPVVRPNLSNSGLAARNWMIHMNPMAQQSFDSGGSSKVLKRQDSRVAQAVMAAVACGGKIGTCSTKPKKRRTSSGRSGSTSTLQGRNTPIRSRSQSVKSVPYGKSHGSRSGSGIIGSGIIQGSSRTGSRSGSRSGSRNDLPSKSHSRSSRMNEDVEAGGNGCGSGTGNTLTLPRRTRTLRRPFRKAISLEEDSATICRQTVVKIEEAYPISEEESTDDTQLLTAMSDVNPAKLYKLRTLSERNESCTE